MIVGLGIDLVEIARIERAMANPRFLLRILTEKEREICVTPARVAGRWAAKEAIVKAVGIPLTWRQIEILPNELGAPHATIHSGYFDPRRLRIQVSITHEKSHAAAVAILERLVMQSGGL